MKKFNFTRIAVLVLSLALLIGSVVCISAAAEETESTGEFGSISVAYGDKVAIRVAVDATAEEINSGAVKVTYTIGETIANAKHYPTEDGKVWVITEGIAAYDLGETVTFNSYAGETQVESGRTYSVAQFLYAKLYRDSVEEKWVELYESLLAYGAAAQKALDCNAETPVNAYSYAYTTENDVTLSGACGYGEITVTATYTGDGILEAWVVTDLEGNETEVAKSEITVNGIVSIAPKLGVHECADALDDGDHVCDICGEVASECSDNDDHLCDDCGKVVSSCVDTGVQDNLCDVCGLYTFEYDIEKNVNLYTFTSTGNANPKQQTTITKDSTGSGYYGVLASLATDPDDATNQVLKMVINGGDQNSNTGGAAKYPNYIKFSPTSTVEGGDIHVFEYDFYAERFNKSGIRNFLTLVAYDSEGNQGPLQNGGADASTNGHTKSLVAVTGTEKVANCFQVGVGSTQTENAKYALFDSHTWYRFRFTYNVTAGTINTSVSFDGGKTWYKAADEQATTSLSTKGVDTNNIEYLAFSATHYGHGEIFYIDNVNYYVTDSIEIPAVSGTDAIEHAAE